MSALLLRGMRSGVAGEPLIAEVKEVGGAEVAVKAGEFEGLGPSSLAKVAALPVRQLQ